MKLKKLEAEIEEVQSLIEGTENIQEKLQEQQKEIINEMKKIGIEKLPYSYSSLQRFIDPKTMNIHYNKHYKGYVDKLNKALEKQKDNDLDLEEIIKGISQFNKTVRNNAGGAFNHALFWKMLTPKRQKIKGEILEKIIKDFGSYEEFKKQFIERAKLNFGSGWCWLVVTKTGKLKIVTTPNQDNPLMNVIKDGGYPLLGLDLWEHAYYLRYQNKKDEYIEKFFLVINWEFVNSLYTSRTEKKLKEEKLVSEILTEGQKSVGCNSSQVKEINRLFSTNPQVKYVLNKLNTNYSSFCILLNDLNIFLKSKEKQPIVFSPNNKEQQLQEVERFCNYLLLLKDRIFNLSTSKTLQEIFKKLKETDERGEKREDDTVIQLKKIFNTDKVEKIGGLGNEEDMISGVDAIININGERKTAQIKPFSYTKDISETEVMVFGASVPKKYKTDFIVFNNPSKTIVFKNNATKILDGNYVFPKDSEIKSV